MRYFIKIICLIPKVIIRIIWDFFWAIFRVIVLIAVIGFGGFYYINHSSSQLAHSISNIVNQVSHSFSATNGNVATSFKDIATDYVNYHSKGARWESNSATLYIQTTNETLIEAYKEAITAWNATGAFTFRIVSNASDATIIAMDYSDKTSNAAGVAETQTNAITHDITHVDVKLNTYYLIENDYGYTHNRVVYTAEHELGHAIGLGHDDKEPSVMQSAGSYYGIQEVDIKAVNDLYQNN